MSIWMWNLDGALKNCIEELIIMHTIECICITFQEYEVYHDQLNVYEATSTSASFVEVFIKSTWYLKPYLHRTMENVDVVALLDI
jgi:hypothetical protein